MNREDPVKGWGVVGWIVMPTLLILITLGLKAAQSPPPGPSPDHLVAYACTPTMGNGPTVAFNFNPAPFPNIHAVIGAVPNSTDKLNPTIASVTTSAGIDLTTGLVRLSLANAGLAFTVTATDNVGVVSGTVEVDGKLATPFGNGIDVLPGQFYVRWNAKSISAGDHAFRLTVWDAAGNPAERTWMMKL